MNNELIWCDVVYVKTTGSDVLLRDVLGEKRIISNCNILEVDVQSEHLVLEKN